MAGKFVIAWKSEFPENPPAFLMRHPGFAHTVPWLDGMCWVEPGHSQWSSTPFVEFPTRAAADAWLVMDELRDHGQYSKWARWKVARDVVPFPGVAAYLKKNPPVCDT